MTRIVALFALAILIAGCQTTGEVLKKYPVGASYNGQVLVGKKQIPLPPGDWEIFASRVSQNSSGVPFLSLVLGNKDRTADVLAVGLHTNTEVSNGNGWVILKACGRTNMLHVDAPDNIEGSAQRCWFVNHSRMTRSGNGVSG